MRDQVSSVKKGHCAEASDRRVGTATRRCERIERNRSKGVYFFRVKKKRKEREAESGKGCQDMPGKTARGDPSPRRKRRREKMIKRKRERGKDGMHRERWQFIRVPVLWIRIIMLNITC